MRVSRLITAVPILILTLALAGVATAQSASELSPDVLEYVAVDAPVVALTHVRVVDGTGAAPAENRTILIENGLITAVGADGEVDIPAGAEVLALNGHTVIPGIVGLHDHTFYTNAGRRVQLSYSAPRLYLGSGVTTIRTTGSYHPYSEINLDAAIESGQSPGPRMYITGPYLTGPAGSGYMTAVATPEDARRIVNYWAEEGVDWFKAYTRISPEALEAAIDEAHRHGLKFTGHLCSVSFQEAVAMGIDNLEHGFFTNTDYYPGREMGECPNDLWPSLIEVDIQGDAVQATFQDMIENDVPMTSTLAVYELYYPGRPPVEQRMLDALAPAVRDDYLAAHEQIAANAASSVMPELFHKAQAFERAFVEAGGLLGAGVDPTGNGGALPGFGDQRNYELLIEAGFTPVEAIEIMTANGARVLGEYNDFGSIEPGKSADLVVIEGNPIANPAGIRNVTLVFKEGVGYDSAKLIDAVDGMVGIR
ncbi:MAG TPA: amidohydrolase family protein [Longimicrobiaceae bacterium]|nr:amidohydrolase family protein [Longimicrobiaceae bacterium]